MSKGASKDYKFGQKNNWRRAVWNEVLRRTNGRERIDQVLYLVGPQDVDRNIAIDKGVPRQNLVAIDRSIQNVDAVRSCGNPAIHGDAQDVLWSWPVSRPVCAVCLDVCQGITTDTRGFWLAGARPPFLKAVFMVNMQRGRDPWSPSLVKPLKAPTPYGNIFDILGLSDKHRGHQFWVINTFIDFRDLLRKGLSELELAGLFEQMLSALNPRFFTYRSGGLVFDSIVFNSIGVLGWFDVAKSESINKLPKMSRQIAAIQAIRTGRLG